MVVWKPGYNLPISLKCNGVVFQDGDSEGDSGFVTPDSTTKEKVSRFVEGQDVLSHGKDGLFYLGVIVVVSRLTV